MFQRDPPLTKPPCTRLHSKISWFNCFGYSLENTWHRLSGDFYRLSLSRLVNHVSDHNSDETVCCKLYENTDNNTYIKTGTAAWRNEQSHVLTSLWNFIIIITGSLTEEIWVFLTLIILSSFSAFRNRNNDLLLPRDTLLLQST